MSIVGARGVRISEVKARKRPKFKRTADHRYRDRQDSLNRLGFMDYAAYLSSQLWQNIRRRAMDRCKGYCRCGQPATQVHHREYDYDTMAGDAIYNLDCVCRECHEKKHGIGQPKRRKKRKNRQRRAITQRMQRPPKARRG